MTTETPTACPQIKPPLNVGDTISLQGGDKSLQGSPSSQTAITTSSAAAGSADESSCEKAAPLQLGSTASSSVLPVDVFRAQQQPSEWDNISLAERLEKFAEIPTGAIKPDGTEVFLKTDDLVSASGFALCGVNKLTPTRKIWNGFYKVPGSFTHQEQILHGVTMGKLVAVGTNSKMRRVFLGVVENDGSPGVSVILFDPASAKITLSSLAETTLRPNDTSSDVEAHAMKKAFLTWTNSQSSTSASDQRKIALETKRQKDEAAKVETRRADDQRKAEAKTKNDNAKTAKAADMEVKKVAEKAAKKKKADEKAAEKVEAKEVAARKGASTTAAAPKAAAAKRKKTEKTEDNASGSKDDSTSDDDSSGASEDEDQDDEEKYVTKRNQKTRPSKTHAAKKTAGGKHKRTHGRDAKQAKKNAKAAADSGDGFASDDDSSGASEDEDQDDEERYVTKRNQKTRPSKTTTLFDARVDAAVEQRLRDLGVQTQYGSGHNPVHPLQLLESPRQQISSQQAQYQARLPWHQSLQQQAAAQPYYQQQHPFQQQATVQYHFQQPQQQQQQQQHFQEPQVQYHFQQQQQQQQHFQPREYY
eukprot:CAMPEP_0171985948 /NCGR_PEP_ID=MMETSP0993-20121228/274614_1 /TAXON_ID=483369 /ORGANISM="non described non described, Strain CCMP2098" /LENGTH=587 /DNA_ID=CAMNT_0012638841 /DNA_START=94 /DNA_END=1857 /DNA_ORIENTATION=-